MAEYEVFTNSPVEEAIITIRLSLSNKPVPSVEALSTAFQASYPIVELIEGDEGEELYATTSAQNFRGFRLLSLDRQQVLQITPRSFSFHWLRPYDRWDVFAQRARMAWRTFVTLFRPRAVTEVQLRFVNVFHLPMPFESWSEYLVIRPEMPPPVDTGLVSYMMSLNLMDVSVPASAVVTQTTHAERDDVAQVVFDIDTRTRFTAGQLTNPQLWRTLERLREYKNRLFFEGITERAKELFR
jgi:uncharacterized protein (TIGR04255 family)